MIRRAAPFLAVLAVLAGCGGDDKKDAEQAVRDFVTATNERDADRLCDELLTKEFIEQATGATGDDARKSCKQQLRAVRGLKLELRRIDSTEVDGDKATVTATVEVQGQEQKRPFALRKEDGEWRLAGGTAQ